MLCPLGEESALIMASLNTSTHARFSLIVSASRGYVRVVALNTKAFSPPPKSSGAFSSTEKPSPEEPMIISPKGNAS